MSQSKCKICIGAANFGEIYGINKKKAISQRALKRIFQYAKQKNIKFIDTSMNYKNSDFKIGKIKLKNINIITKISNFPKKDSDLENWIINQVVTSCKKLKIKSLYGLLIHKTNELKNKKRSKKIFKAFDYIIKKRLVKKIGLSIYEPKELNRYFKSYNFRIVQAPLNIFDRRLVSSGWFKKLKNKKVEVHARSIFLQGLLLKESSKITSKFKKWKKQIIYFEKWTNNNNISKVEACLRLTNNFIGLDQVILGIRDKDQLNHNYLALKKGKLNVPSRLIINKGKIIDPRKWKL